MSMSTVVMVVAIMWMIGWGQRRRRSPEESRRLRELEQAVAARDEELDRLHERLAEVESRLDFTERLLAKSSEQ